MALHTNIIGTHIISNSTVLPFSLYIKPLPTNNFKTESLTPVHIDKLVHTERLLKDVVYTIEEYKNFSIALESEVECEVTIKWSIIKSDISGNDFKVFTLTNASPVHEVYKYHKNNPFPWSVDIYHFEIIYHEETYYGMFQITPKNMSSEELEWMRSMINDKLYGLVIDYMKYKRSWSTLDSIKETPFWHLWEWYKSNESKLLNQITMIEQQSSKAISKTYKVQESPKKLDNQSIRWANTPKGLMHNQMKFLNRRIHYIDDSEENRNSKYFIRQISLKLCEIEAMVRQVKSELVERHDRLLIEINESQMKHDKIKLNSRIADIEKTRYHNIVYHKTREAKSLIKQVLNYNDMCEQIEQNLNRLSTAVNNDFWIGIATKPSQRIVLGNHPSYKIIYKIYQEMSVMLTNDNEKEMQLPVYKRTDELYEYFVFFSVIDLFIQQGFTNDEVELSAQLKTSFYQEGIRDGTTVQLYREDLVVYLVFNEEIAMNEESATTRFSRLMTEQENRKPDLRLDAYRLVDETLVYDSSIVLEIKCRPLRNIYDSNGRTTEMIQMASYKHILRINTPKEMANKGEKYNTHAIRFVLCLYAGKNKYKDSSLEVSCGKFIRFTPQVEEDPTNLALVAQEIFHRWLKLPE